MKIKKVLLFSIIGSSLFFATINCSEEESTPTPENSYMQYEGISGEIGYGGGTIEIINQSSNLNGTVIAIPEGALDETVNLSISEVQSPAIFESNENEIAIKLEPEGTDFNKPVSITMPYASAISSSVLKVFYYNFSDSSITPMQISQTISESNLVSFSTDHFSIYFTTGNSLNVCSGEIPNEANVKDALTNFVFDGTSEATHNEAVDILKHLCSLVSIHYPDENTVCGEFPSGYHLTLWVGTYDETDRYGARYGTDDDHSFWGSNDTYFEIVKSLDLNLDGTWQAIEYIDKDGRDMLNGFSFTQEQTLCDGNCILDLTWNAKYENFQVIFDGASVTMNYYITLDYPSYNCTPCQSYLPNGVWDSSDQDIRYATCNYATSIMNLVNFILAYGGELYYPTIMEYTGNYLYLKEGTAELKMQKID